MLVSTIVYGTAAFLWIACMDWDGFTVSYPLRTYINSAFHGRSQVNFNSSGR